MQFFNIGLSGLLNAFLNVLIDIVDEIVFRFDSLDDPVIHLVDQYLKIAPLLQHSFIDLIADTLNLSLDIGHEMGHKLF